MICTEMSKVTFAIMIKFTSIDTHTCVLHKTNSAVASLGVQNQDHKTRKEGMDNQEELVRK